MTPLPPPPSPDEAAAGLILARDSFRTAVASLNLLTAIARACPPQAVTDQFRPLMVELAEMVDLLDAAARDASAALAPLAGKGN